MLALGFHLGAYVTETIRAGLTSIRPGQMRAALALGMSRFQAIRTIILPQALIRMLPPLGSLIVIAVKDSAIASVIAVPELLRQSQVLAGKTYRPFEIYTGGDAGLFPDLFPVRARSIDRIYRRLAPSGRVVTTSTGPSSGTTAGASAEGAESDRGPDASHHGDRRCQAVSFSPCCGSRRSRRRRGAATGFVEFFRATAADPADLLGLSTSCRPPSTSVLGFTTALIGLACNVSAFNSETFRAGIRSIRTGSGTPHSRSA